MVTKRFTARAHVQDGSMTDTYGAVDCADALAQATYVRQGGVINPDVQYKLYNAGGTYSHATVSFEIGAEDDTTMTYKDAVAHADRLLAAYAQPVQGVSDLKINITVDTSDFKAIMDELETIADKIRKLGRM
jgi:hypothetical protein